MLDIGLPSALAPQESAPLRTTPRFRSNARILPESSLRVAFVITRADAVGGASIHVRDMARLLISEGHEAMVFLGGEGAVTDALRREAVPYRVISGLVRNVDPRKDAVAVLRLRSALKAYSPDLVSTHTSKAGVIGRLAAWTLGIPAIYTPHCWSFVDGFPGARFYLLAERLARPFGRRIIMVSEAERQDGLRARVAPAPHLVTVHNGMPDIPDDLRSRPGALSPRIVMVGRFEKQKDHESLLRGLARIQHLAWRLDLVGDGPMRAEAEELAAKLGIANRVTFHGYRNDVEVLLSDAQVFTLITHWEGFPRSIIEAMRAGLPVVATNVGGNAESVKDGVNGFIVGRRDIAAIGDRMAALLADPQLRERMGEAGRRLYEREFTLHRMMHKTANVWADVLKRPVRIGRANTSPEQSQRSLAA